MAVLGAERATLVAEVANRLRMMQVDCAGLTPQERQQFFSDVIDKAMAAVVPGERAAFLEALQARFPAWNGQTQPSASAAASAQRQGQPAAAEAPELRDPKFLLNRLLEMAPTFSPDDQKYVVAQMQKAGLPVGGGNSAAPAPVAGVPDEVVKWFRESFKLQGTQRLDAARLMGLLPVVLELTCGMHQFVWTAWRTLAPNSELRPALVSLQSAVTRYAAGDPGVTLEQLSREMTKLRQLTAALVAAIGETGRQFATNHCAKFSPNEIEAIVRMEGGGGLLGGKEKKYWEKYKALFGEQGEETVEGEIRETIAKHVELLMKGLVR
jgi:hypothetical protein